MNTPVDYAAFDEVLVDRVVRRGGHNGRIRAADAAEITRRLVAQGLSDGQIAARLRCYRRTVQRIRKRLAITAALPSTGSSDSRIPEHPNRPRRLG